ncbi:MAG: TIGR02270 family protein, partial [Bryobacterales bacterium]|nr:TIGR02270 family protein [Bryobacterales bacterium]
MVNRGVVDQHALEAAFLWSQRDHAVTAPNYSIHYLQKPDARCEAHLEGLRTAREHGWQAILEIMDQGAGEVFAASVLAFGSGDPRRIAKAVEIGLASPETARGLVSALGWLEPVQALPQAARLLESNEAVVSCAGLAAYAIHRVDPGAAVGRAITHPDWRLSTRALQAASELGRLDLVAVIRSVYPRPEAAHAAARLGDREADTYELLRIAAATESPIAPQALDTVIRCMSTAEVHAWRAHLPGRLKLQAAGVVGDPAAVPEILSAMADPDLARAAGASLSLMTGLDIAYENLEGDPPEEETDASDEPPADAFGDYEFPSAEKCNHWWRRRAADFLPGVRYLNGNSMADSQGLHKTLATAYQPQRIAAAWELAVRYPDSILFETRARAHRQAVQVSPW